MKQAQARIKKLCPQISAKTFTMTTTNIPPPRKLTESEDITSFDDWWFQIECYFSEDENFRELFTNQVLPGNPKMLFTVVWNLNKKLVTWITSSGRLPCSLSGPTSRLISPTRPPPLQGWRKNSSNSWKLNHPELLVLSLLTICVSRALTNT